MTSRVRTINRGFQAARDTLQKLAATAGMAQNNGLAAQAATLEQIADAVNQQDDSISALAQRIGALEDRPF